MGSSAPRSNQDRGTTIIQLERDLQTYTLPDVPPLPDPKTRCEYKLGDWACAIVFSAYAGAKLHYLLMQSPVEVGWYAYTPNSPFIVEDLFVLPQISSGASFDFEDAPHSAFCLRMEAAGFEWWQYRSWLGHFHPDMSANPSGRDDRVFATMGQYQPAGMFIASKSTPKQYSAVYRIPHPQVPNIGVSSNLKVVFRDWDDPLIRAMDFLPLAAWREELKRVELYKAPAYKSGQSAITFPGSTKGTQQATKKEQEIDLLETELTREGEWLFPAHIPRRYSPEWVGHMLYFASENSKAWGAARYFYWRRFDEKARSEVVKTIHALYVHNGYSGDLDNDIASCLPLSFE